MNKDLRVAILIPTMNRPDFVIRQIRYYASVNCPHTIYIGDSSNLEDSEKVKSEINKLKSKVNIVYEYLPGLNRGTADTAKHLLSIVKEKYSCYSCDDDVQVPNSLTICAEFLENNPDYATVGGYQLNFRLLNNSAYGDFDRISDCPIPEILDDNAADRLTHFFSDNFVPLFLVNRTDQFLEDHKHVLEVKDHILSSELLPSALSIVAGKSITLDCLGYMRQIHNQHRVQLSPFEWIISPDWNESYRIFEGIVSRAISEKDKISPEEAVKATRVAFPGQLLKWFGGRKIHKSPAAPINKYFYEKFIKPVRSKVAATFPFLKYIYRIKVKQKLKGKKEIHYEARRPGSRYYNDFKHVVDSFADKI